MATYYVDYTNGSDANNGLGPDASHASNKPWKTIGKALGATGISSGDTVYLAPGSFREVVTVAMTSATVETKIIGDYANAQGFKTSGGVRVTPAPVIWTAYTTDDKTAPSASVLLTLAGRDWLTFQNIMFVGGTNATTSIVESSATAIHITFSDCVFTGPPSAAALLRYTCGTSVKMDLLIDRCVFFTTRQAALAITFTIGNSGSATGWDAGINITNSVCFGGGELLSTGGGAGSGPYPGGMFVRNCLYIGSNKIMGFATQVGYGDKPSGVYNTVGIGNTAAFVSAYSNTGGWAGSLLEDYNVFYSSAPRTNVTAGTHTITDSSYAPLFHFGQERIWNGFLRQFGEPMAGSPFLAYGNDGSQTATDFRGTGHIRPAGGASASPAVGVMERGNTFVADAAPIGSNTTAIKCTGPAYGEFVVPVKAQSTTISCKVKWDATYAGTKPQLQLDANGRIGVTAQTVTATGASGAVETLTLAGFTPTAAGDYVRVRVISNDTNGAGVLQVDNFSVV